MKRISVIWLAVLWAVVALAAPADTNAALKKETLVTTDGDQVEVYYSVQHSKQGVVVQFTADPYIKSKGHSHSKIDEKTLKLAFFTSQRINKDEKISWNNFTIEPLFTSNATVKSVSDGYCEIWKYNTMEFSLASTDKPSVSLPVYLVRKKGDHKHEIIAKFSQPLTIDLTPPPAQQPKARRTDTPTDNAQTGAKGGGTSTTEEVVEERVVEGGEGEPLPGDGGNPGVDVQSLIAKMEACLSLSDDQLNDEASKLFVELAGAKPYATPEQLEKINQIESQVNAKKNAAALKLAADKAEAEAKAQKQHEDDQKRLEEEKKKTWWMFGLGGLLAVLLFVGNQVMQSLRNRAQARSMKELQDRAMQQAESKVTHAAQRAVDKKVHQAERAAENAVRGKVDQAGQAARNALRRGRDNDAPAEPPTDNADTPSTPSAAERAAESAAQRKANRANETLQDKARRAAQGARIKKNRDKDGTISI